MKTLDEWLQVQQQAHGAEIKLGLDRVRGVWQRLGARRPAPCVITVGGTNGKGSTVALIEAMLSATGQAVGCYTSPHLLRYNERVRLRGADVTDAALVAAFERIDAARGGIALTWFEFGTLAALELLADAGLDVALLEVGLGGRLDAVNVIDADAAIVTSIGIDHVEYLGPDRDSIGYEKAGIFRPGRPAVVGDDNPPARLLEAARAKGAQLLRAGVDFELVRGRDAITWRFSELRSDGARETLAALDLCAAHVDEPGRQGNLAAALAALFALRERLPWRPHAYARAALAVHPPARVQRIGVAPELVVDVAHNPHAARSLAAWLRRHPVSGRTRAVYGAMRDKDVPGVAAILGPLLSQWICCPLPDAGARGLAAAEVAARVRAGYPLAACTLSPSVTAALQAARAAAAPDDRVLAFGSFHLAGAALRAPHDG